MFLLMRVSATPHFHPDQLAVALVITVAIVGGSWALQRRRS
jgi:hypothetical protein